MIAALPPPTAPETTRRTTPQNRRRPRRTGRLRTEEHQRHRPAVRKKQRQIFAVGGYVMSGERMSQVILGEKGRKGLRFIAAVPGFTLIGLRKKLFAQLRMLRIFECPFNGAPEVEGLTEEMMEDCLWVEPGVKVWVEFDRWTESGHLDGAAVVAQA